VQLVSQCKLILAFFFHELAATFYSLSLWLKIDKLEISRKFAVFREKKWPKQLHLEATCWERSIPMLQKNLNTSVLFWKNTFWNQIMSYK